MANKEKMSTTAHAEHEKAILSGGAGLVVKLDSTLVVENGLGFLEGYPVFLEVRGGFCRIPFKLNHLYIVWMTEAFARRRGRSVISRVERTLPGRGGGRLRGAGEAAQRRILPSDLPRDGGIRCATPALRAEKPSSGTLVGRMSQQASKSLGFSAQPTEPLARAVNCNCRHNRDCETSFFDTRRISIDSMSFETPIYRCCLAHGRRLRGIGTWKH